MGDRFVADPQAMARTCPRCHQPPRSRCIGPSGQQVPTHSVRRRADEQEEVSTG